MLTEFEEIFVERECNMLTIFEKVELLAKKTGKTPDFIKERLGITPKIAQRLQTIDRVETVEEIENILRNLKKSSRIVHMEVCRKWEYLTSIDDAVEEILHRENQETNHDIRVILTSRVDRIR